MGQVKLLALNLLQITKIYVFFLNYLINIIFIIAVKGTPFYFSPELWKIFESRATEGDYNPMANDIYSIGLICLELFLG